MVNSFFLAFESALKKVAIFPQIVQQTGQARFLHGPERLGVRGSPPGHIAQVLFQRLRRSARNCGTVRVITDCHKPRVLAGTGHGD